jgi:hypothetical protein
MGDWLWEMSALSTGRAGTRLRHPFRNPANANPDASPDQTPPIMKMRGF